MITKNDCILLLTDLQESGIDIGDLILKVIKSNTVSIDVLKFINANRELELTKFYENLRKNYNNKRSKLYINIIRDTDDVDNVTTVLASYLLQATLFSKTTADSQMFLRHARVKEVNMALAKYYTDFDLDICVQLLKLIRTDMMACEIISGRRTA